MSEELLKELPSGWVWSKLGDVVTKVIGGGTPSKNNPQYWNGNIPWLTVKDMRTRRPADAKNHITEEGVEKSSTNIIPEDTVIIATRIGLGKVVRVPYKAAINQDLKALILPPDVQKGYLEYWFVSKANHLESIGSGTTVKGIRLEQVRNLDFPLAPPEQQKRIVAKIEELFSHIDAGIEALKKAQKLLKQYRQSVLKAAVTGELTKDWREQNKGKLEPASQLLERILKEHRQKWEEQQLRKFQAKGKMPKDDKWKEKYKEPKKPALLVDLENPNEWEMASVDQVAEIWLGKMLDKGKHATGESIQYLRNINVRWGRIDTDNLLKMFFKESELKRYDLSAGDVLVCEGGEPGRSAVWEGGVTLKYQKALHRVRFHLPLIPQYLVYLLEYFASTGLLQRYFTGSTIKHFTKESFTTLPFPLPSILEMEQMVFRVEEKLYSINKLEDELDIQLLKAEKNKQSILASAFNGRFN
ncbi:MAG: hypothetical protein A6F72_06570 [Cycloclasticus sp. symbiont of Poecilosclerida sp. N]|nr:MAG: hypothetical protein A6F72_06570 [Cycloclasticus sp. symbiont of Poecilosclerida sp. N]